MPSWDWSSSSAKCIRPAITPAQVCMKDTIRHCCTWAFIYIDIYSHAHYTVSYKSLIYLSLFGPQLSIPQQKLSCLHPVLRLVTDVAAQSTALSVGQAGKVQTMASHTLITLDLPCLRSSSVSPWRDGRKCSTGSVPGWTYICLYFKYLLCKVYCIPNRTHCLWLNQTCLSG